MSQQTWVTPVRAPLTPERKRALAIRIMRYTALAFLVVWPWYRSTFILLGDANVAEVYVIVGASLVLLTGWVGQISLAQASFVGIGAFLTAIVSKGLHLGFPLSTIVAALAAAGAASLLGVVALRVRGLYLAVATLIFAWMADTYLFLTPWLSGGTGSEAVKSLPIGVQGTFPYFDFTNRRTFYYVGLAVAALLLFALANLRDSKTGRAFFALKGSEVAAASLGVNVTRYKLLAFALSGFVAGIAGNLTALYQGSLTASQFSFTVSLFYLAIPVVGGLQSLWGSVAAAVLFGALSDVFFRVTALNGYLPLVSAGLLAVVLLAYPAGLSGVPEGLARVAARLRTRWTRRQQARFAEVAVLGAEGAVELDAPEKAAGGLAQLVRSGTRRGTLWARASAVVGGRLTRARGPAVAGSLLPLEALGLVDESLPGSWLAEAPSAEDPAEAGEARGPAPSEPEGGSGEAASVMASMPDWAAARALRPSGPRAGRRVVLEAESITVRFGGLTAVNDVSLAVRQGEIVGLIGPNGAGKTTLFNAIAGLNRPTTGTVTIFGTDATPLPVHVRAQLGVGRTFQAIQLLTDLSIFENLLVATHLQNSTGFLSHMAVTAQALEAEDRARALVARVLELLGLAAVAERRAGDLPFGVLRMVEIARALVTRSPLVMLDEPASGLDNTETERLADLLFYLRGVLGISILLIEHDVHLVTSVCDHIYVIDRGNLIAEGPTDAVQRDPAVIAAYLGQAPGPGIEAVDGVSRSHPLEDSGGGPADRNGARRRAGVGGRR